MRAERVAPPWLSNAFDTRNLVLTFLCPATRHGGQRQHEDSQVEDQPRTAGNAALLYLPCVWFRSKKRPDCARCYQTNAVQELRTLTKSLKPGGTSFDPP